MSKNMIGRAAEFLKFSLNEEALKLYRFVKDLFVFFSRRTMSESKRKTREVQMMRAHSSRASWSSTKGQFLSK